jgi:microcystin-dependent protein
VIDVGTLENLTCRSDLASIPINSKDYPLIYDTSKVKDVYYINGQFQIIDSANSGFPSGMIVMHSGISIPDGWAPCDGKTHWYQGQKYTTPNLVGRFIKAVDSYYDIGPGNVHNNGKNNEFTLGEHHLPAHTHPHSAHTHAISEITGTLGESGDLNLTSTSEYMTETGVTTINVSTAGSEELTSVIDGIEDIKSVVGTSGGNHTHTLTISGGSVSSETSTESEKIWSNQSFKIEPNYYSLIFIMKL